MEQFCLNGGISVDEWIQEIGGGMNFKREEIGTAFTLPMINSRWKKIEYTFQSLDG